VQQQLPPQPIDRAQAVLSALLVLLAVPLRLQLLVLLHVRLPPLVIEHALGGHGLPPAHPKPRQAATTLESCISSPAAVGDGVVAAAVVAVVELLHHYCRCVVDEPQAAATLFARQRGSHRCEYEFRSC